MEYSTSTRSVVVPRCETCNGKFAPKTKVSCADCECKIHYDCAVYADDDCSDMLCLNCFKNKKIEKGLERDGILVKVKGDDLCRAYIGKHYWEQEEDKGIKILGDCSEELECEIINDTDDDDACKYCGWRCEYPESHIRYGNWKCEYIKSKYDLNIDEDGELEWKEKKFNPEPFESSDFVKYYHQPTKKKVVKKKPVCAFGYYCSEDLYKRGCLPNWEKRWICEECKTGLNPPVCGRHLGFGEYCDEKSSYPHEYCLDCMKHELGMY